MWTLATVVPVTSKWVKRFGTEAQKGSVRKGDAVKLLNHTPRTRDVYRRIPIQMPLSDSTITVSKCAAQNLHFISSELGVRSYCWRDNVVS